MGHDIHFLERLDRVSLPYAELALSLYRDPDLVREILGRVDLPDGDSRVAISLGDDAEGPYIIVSRDGRFITCLGEGMVPRGLPVVSRSRLDAIAARAQELRERMALARSLVGPKHETKRLLTRIFEAGGDLSREEFLGISAFIPVVGTAFLDVYLDLSTTLEKARDRIVSMRRPEHAGEKIFRAYSNAVFALGHLALLIAMDDGRKTLEEIVAKLENQALFIGWPAVRQGVFSVALRGTWAVGKGAKTLLPSYRRGFAEAEALRSLLDSALGLAAIAHRHAKLRSQAAKTLFTTEPAGCGRDPDDNMSRILATMRALLREGLDDPQPSIDFSRSLGAKLYLAYVEGFADPDLPRFGNPEEVPDDLAFAAYANTHMNFMKHTKALWWLFRAVPWLARRRPEEFYYPAAIVKALKEPWIQKEAIDLYEAAESPRRREPIRVEPKPGRNDPCPCGSGKKYKKCCER